MMADMHTPLKPSRRAAEAAVEMEILTACSMTTHRKAVELDKRFPDYDALLARSSQDAETIKALREALMKAGQSAGFQYMTAETRDEIEAALANAPRCEHCDGTGDVHRADGEWLGTCTCAAAYVGLVEVAP